MLRFCLFFLCLITTAGAYAQLCTGSLGDPVVKITFGNALTPTGPLGNNVTSMTYTSSTCPDDGFYTITNNAPGCFTNSWHTLNRDHTGDAGGKVMLINASYDPSDFFVQTVTGLCGNTIYEFASWITNVILPSSCNNSSIRPNLTFRIETIGGQVLKQFETGDIDPTATLSWKQYGTFFQTPAGTSDVVIRIRNNSRGGCGNDLALDDITFRPCGPNINTRVNGAARDTLQICETDRQSYQLTATYTNEYSDPVLQWQQSTDTGRSWQNITGATTTTYNRLYSGIGLFQYRLLIVERLNQGGNCGVASSPTTIIVHPLPNSSANKQVTGCEGDPAALTATGGVSLTYRWTDITGLTNYGNGQQLYFSSLRAVDDGRYIAWISGPGGCVRQDTFQLTVLNDVTATVNTSTGVCEGNSLQLTATGGTSYQWTPAAGLSANNIGNPIASPADTTRYQVVVANALGCTDTLTTDVFVWKNPIPDAGEDRVAFEGRPITLSGQITGGSYASLYWTPATGIVNANTLSPVITPTSTTTYTLHVVSAFGCGTFTDDMVLQVYQRVVPPNAFSPNGDGVNDTWVIPGLDTYPTAVLSVFTRGGQIVYESRGYSRPWDGTYKGKSLPIGTYYYLIQLNSGEPPVSGAITIIR
jgi:gliding motility-associated-like protein